MNDGRTEATHFVSDGGIAANHRVLQEQSALVGPATGSEFNTIKAGIIPLACWRLEDMRFEFDSSIVKPEIKTELESLAKLVGRHPPLSKAEKSQPPELGCPLSVFGHADPTGNDDYNKHLSGRRAKAIYALVTRRTELWEELFSQPFGNDKWGRRALEIMLDFVSSSDEETAPNSTPSQNSTDASKTNQALIAQHERDSGKRKVLFFAYMEKLCGPELKLQKTDFLGHGDDAGGQADFQGCSEFNPVLIFSQTDQNKFEHDKDKTARNTANASNRRVMILIFRKGSRVIPSKWPCPRVNEGVAGCKKRFWSDGEKRRNTRLPDDARKFENTKDTFACRFYQRISDNSPCERIAAFFKIRLFDSLGQPLPRARFVVVVSGVQSKPRSADANGDITLPDPGVDVVTVRWSPAPDQRKEVNLPEEVEAIGLDGQIRKVRISRDPPPEFEFEIDVFLTLADLTVGAGEGAAALTDDAARKRLNNMGYVEGDEIGDLIRAFQRDLGDLETGRLSDVADKLKDFHDVKVSSPRFSPGP